MSKARKENPISYWKGKKRSLESRLKMSKNHNFNSNKSGKENANWQGGITDMSRYSRNRRNRKFNASGYHTFGEWENLKAQYNWTCPACKKIEPDIKLTEDHIIPLSVGGSDNIENIQPLCKSCNCRKHAKIIKY